MVASIIVSGFLICGDEGALVGAGWEVGEDDAPVLAVVPPFDELELPDDELEAGCVGAAGAQEASVTAARLTNVNITTGIREGFLIFLSPC
jgi:hypothetical protein